MMLAASSIFYVFVYPYLSGQVAAEKRQAQFKQGKAAKRANERVIDQNKRRQQILESVKDIETDTRKKKNTLQSKIFQAGLKIDVRKFIILSGLLGIVVAVVIGIANQNPLIGVGAGVVVGLGLPRWILSFLAKRRLTKFLAEFPVAVEIIIRGVKAGLPLGQCLHIIAGEANEPVRSEFRKIVESLSIGLSVGEAIERLPESMPVAEANFFSIVINLQQKSGGNLAEALGNLARLLRDRRKMKLKVAALSSESKASAAIIAALPFFVAGLVYFSAPSYIMLLFTTQTGHMVLGASACWMAVGVFVMKRMINFDF
ncbi:MAG: type II secretion system F family protein [Hyphomicrobiales bacterium]|nr:type II secretion system F family protein [Hyphomicrobiales bacterium]